MPILTRRAFTLPRNPVRRGTAAGSARANVVGPAHAAPPGKEPGAGPARRAASRSTCRRSAAARWCAAAPMESYLPLFPGYVFLLADREERVTALATGRVVRSLHVRDQARLWDDLGRLHRLARLRAAGRPRGRPDAGDGGRDSQRSPGGPSRQGAEGRLGAAVRGPGRFHPARRLGPPGGLPPGAGGRPSRGPDGPNGDGTTPTCVPPRRLHDQGGSVMETSPVGDGAGGVRATHGDEVRAGPMPCGCDASATHGDEVRAELNSGRLPPRRDGGRRLARCPDSPLSRRRPRGARLPGPG